MNYIAYSQTIIVVIIFLLQLRLFVTPELLERKHREIMDKAEEKFATLDMLINLRHQVDEIKIKIDKIYDCLMNQ